MAMKDPFGEYAFKVRSYECEPDGMASLAAVCDYLQEAASLNAAELGFSKSDFDASGRNISWVLTRMRVEMSRYPRWAEEARVVTRPKAARRIAAYRDFEIFGADGARIGRAASEWMVIDLSTRRAAPVPPGLFDAFEKTVPPVFGELAPFEGKIRFPETPAADGQTFVAQRSHIDLNGHVNNVRYVEWMLESAPDAAARRPRDVEFAFRSETLAGETVVSRCAPAPGGGLAYCVSSPAGVAHLLAIARA